MNSSNQAPIRNENISEEAGEGKKAQALEASIAAICESVGAVPPPYILDPQNEMHFCDDEEWELLLGACSETPADIRRILDALREAYQSGDCRRFYDSMPAGAIHMAIHEVAEEERNYLRAYSGPLGRLQKCQTPDDFNAIREYYRERAEWGEKTVREWDAQGAENESPGQFRFRKRQRCRIEFMEDLENVRSLADRDAFVAKYHAVMLPHIEALGKLAETAIRAYDAVAEMLREKLSRTPPAGKE